MQTKEQIVKEFRDKFTGLPSCKVEIEGDKQTLFFPDIESFWLAKIDQIKEERDREVNEQLKKYIGTIFSNSKRLKILNLISGK